MSGMSVPDSPKYGYDFDGQEHDVRRSRLTRRCEGGRGGRGGGPGKYSEECTGTISKGDIAVATLIEPYHGENYACVPCALAVRAIEDAS